MSVWTMVCWYVLLCTQRIRGEHITGDFAVISCGMTALTDCARYRPFTFVRRTLLELLS